MRAKVDGTTRPWLMKRLVDPDAEYFFDSADTASELARQSGGTPLYGPGDELDHHVEGDREFLSLDAILEKHCLHGPSLLDVAGTPKGPTHRLPTPHRNPRGPKLRLLGSGSSPRTTTRTRDCSSRSTTPCTGAAGAGSRAP
ncbi:MAG: chromate resistance protein [Nitrososphaerota archaeon]|nr:chromate resistance protein [Nitrososphaerota archaeon]